MKFFVFALCVSLTFCLVFAQADDPAPKEESKEEVTDLIQAYIKEYQYIQTIYTRTSKFDFLLSKMQFSWTFAPEVSTERSQKKFSVICTACELLVKMLIDERRIKNKTLEEISKTALDQCVFLNIQPANVCKGLIELNAPVIVYIIDNQPNATAPSFCSLVLQANQCGNQGEYFEFSVDVDQANAKPITESKSATPASLSKPLKIVQITDIHYDPSYTVGANAKCGEPTCCRKKQGAATSFVDAAGYWGDYRDCDTPLQAVQELFDHVKESHSDADFIYFTGDIVDHGVWETSKDLITESYSTIHKLFENSFSNSSCYWALGNHEAQPVNLFAPSDITEETLSSQWMYDLAAEKWSTWLPASTQETIKTGGYYTVEMQTGLRLVVLNNNDCYTYNFWILYDPQYLSKQLQWLHDTLLNAEKNNEKVHILAHVPSGDTTCLNVWAREYRRILDRFWDTIVAQFNGHTHANTFNVIYSRENPDFAVGQAWNGGSVTTYSNLNRNFVVYSVDRESFEILDVESFYYNLTAANLNYGPSSQPEWKKLYSFKSDFGLADLSPASLDGLTTRLAQKPKLLKQHWRNTVRLGDKSLEKGCNKACKKFTLCDIVINEMEDNRKCEQLLEVFNNH